AGLAVQVSVMHTRVLVAAVLFAVAMGALEHGGGWGFWLAVGWGLLTGARLPIIGPLKLSPANRHIIRQNHITRRWNRKNMRRMRRENRQKLRHNKRNPGFHL